ncbi:MAG TPA: beta-propeller fold lactonase family protein [Candidatus Aquilonibacter sp.]|nr:beta-propeller fold lactonase family protein [Candidatus Aquilonibacter sp.]
MLKKAVVLILVCGSIAGWTGCQETSSHYVYAALPGPSEIAAFREDPNSGVLTALSGSPFPSGAGPESIAIHPSGKYLYALNAAQAQADVSLFDIAGDGALTEVTPRAPVGSVPKVLAMDAAGSFLYVANGGSNNVTVFSIDSSDGALTEVSGSPFPVGMSPLDMKLNPAGNVLYVTGSPNILAAFGITASSSAATLTLIARSDPSTSPGNGPNSIAIAPSGNYLYTANTLDSSISIFPLDPSGTFEPPTVLSEAAGARPLSLVIDPTGTYLFAANNHGNNIAVYTIASGSGALAAVSSSPFASETAPSFLAVDPSGKYLLVGSQNAAGIQTFGIAGGTGQLNSIATFSTANTPSSIVVVK